MKCKKCNGNGKIKVYDGIGTQHYAVCDFCNGTGYAEQTNKDLIQSASTEQLVDELFRFWMEVIYHNEFELREEEVKFVKLKIKEWLKQPLEKECL